MEGIAEKVRNLLKEMGFGEYEASAYSILAFSGPLSAVEVAEFTRIPRPRIYDTIKKLEEKCVAINEGGKPTKYNVIPPSELVKLLEDEENRRDAAIRRTCGELLSLLGPSYEKIAPAEGVSYSLKGTDSLIQTFLEMLESAENASVTTSSAHSFVMKRPEIVKLIKNPKLNLRIIADRMLVNIPMAKVKAHSVSDKFGMVIADGRECLFMTVEGESHEYNIGCYIRDSKMCAGFETAFNVLWSTI
jgi:sugar-specific transcriptional regulator TrmB